MKNIFKPILFSTPMVNAILDGSKTQTRRTKKLEIVNDCPEIWSFVDFQFTSETDRRRQAIFRCWKDTWALANLPYEIGDILWVRETWLEYKTYDKKKLELKNHYKTDHSPLLEPYLKHIKKKWTPSIHMPKKAARIFLKVKSIRVERLISISENDAVNEGCSKYGPFGEFKGSEHPNGGSMKFRAYSKASRAFQCIWETINGKDSWNINPFVWVIEFEKIDKPLDFTV